MSTAAGQYPRPVEHLCLLPTQQPERPFETRRHLTVPRSSPCPAPPAPTPLEHRPHGLRGPAAQPSRPAHPSHHTPPTSSVLTSGGLCFYTRTLSSGQKAASPQTSHRPSSAEKLSHPRPSLATPFNSWVVFLVALCSMWGLGF